MIKLIPMEESVYQQYLKTSTKEYGEEHVKAGNWHPSEAHARAEREFQDLLPKGLSTENNYIYTICDESTGTHVGMIWIAVSTNRAIPSAFIYDFRIDEEHRRKGYATEALVAIEDKILELGVHQIGLHVFGHNHAARALYEKVGYQITGLMMRKELKSKNPTDEFRD